MKVIRLISSEVPSDFCHVLADCCNGFSRNEMFNQRVLLTGLKYSAAQIAYFGLIAKISHLNGKNR